MNLVILGAVLVQWFVSTKNRLAGAIMGLLITFGIAIWGLGLYAQGYQVAFFGMALSQGLFLIFIFAWLVYDVVQIVQAAAGKVNVRLAEDTTVYHEPSTLAPVALYLHKGDSLDLSVNNKKVDGVVWSQTKLADGTWGYLPGSTPIIRKWKTLQKETNVYSQPDKESQVLEVLGKNVVIELGKTEQTTNGIWVKVQTDATPEGYILGDTRGIVVKQ